MRRMQPKPASPAAKQKLISDTVRQQIVRGQLPPGGRLPTQVQLVEQFQVSGVTVQRALDRLLREGFICTRGRLGTFVADRPPHLSHYALVFPDQPKRGEHRSRYYETLESQAFRLQRSGDRKISVLHGLSGRHDEESSRQLLGDLRAHRLAGLMLVNPESLEDVTLLEEPDTCRVAIMGNRVTGMQCPIVYPDMQGMIDLGLDALAKKGRKNLAVLTTVPVYKEIADHLRHAAAARGMNLPEHWLQIVPDAIVEGIRNNILLMMNPGAGARPDAMFIVDDNLAEGAAMGLVDSNIRVPHDLEVVAHCNFPWLAPSVLPFQRVGFDTRKLLDAAVNVIDSQRRGEPSVPFTPIPAIFEEQFEPF